MEVKLSDRFRHYLLLSEFHEEKKKFAQEKEVNKDLKSIKKEFGKYAKSEDVRSDMMVLREALKKLQASIGNELATKKDITYMEAKILRWAKDTFVTNEGKKSDEQAIKNQIEDLFSGQSTLRQRADALEVQSTYYKEEIPLKATIKQIELVQE